MALRFRPDREPRRGAPWSMLAVFAAVSMVVGLRAWWPSSSSPPSTLVEVLGDVPRPGTYAIDDPTVRTAVARAGGAPAGLPDTPVQHGHRITVSGGSARVEPPSDPMLVGLPIDPNHADAAALSAIPGVGASTAAAIVAERERGGPFRSFDDLGDVPGLFGDRLDGLRPFVAIEPPPPVDLNAATIEQLQRLDGIGPVLAERIVAARSARGRFERRGELAEVQGIGAQLVDALAGQVTPD